MLNKYRGERARAVTRRIRRVPYGCPPSHGGTLGLNEFSCSGPLPAGDSRCQHSHAASSAERRAVSYAVPSAEHGGSFASFDEPRDRCDGIIDTRESSAMPRSVVGTRNPRLCESSRVRCVSRSPSSLSPLFFRRQRHPHVTPSRLRELVRCRERRADLCLAWHPRPLECPGRDWR
jgi:hypothetical protein